MAVSPRQFSLAVKKEQIAGFHIALQDGKVEVLPNGKGLDDLRGPVGERLDRGPELPTIPWGFLAVQLQGLQSVFPRLFEDLSKGGIHTDPDLFDSLVDLGDPSPKISGGGFPKDKAQIVGFQREQLQGIVFHAADLQLHGSSFLMNSEALFPGSSVFIKCSPMRNPLYPYSLSSTIASVEEIPLSETFTKSEGMWGDSFLLVPRSTSKVLRLRLFTPRRSRLGMRDF